MNTVSRRVDALTKADSEDKREVLQFGAEVDLFWVRALPPSIHVRFPQQSLRL